MSSKRKCIVILLFIVLVTILFILYNRSQFFLGISYRCKYSVYEVHSKSFKNHSNLPVTRSLNVSLFQKIVKMHRRLLPHNSKLKSNFTTTTDLPPLPENTLKTQKMLLFYTGLEHPSNHTMYNECPEGRILTVLLTGRLGNVIWEYMSLIAVEELYSDQLNMQAYMPGNMKMVLELLFEDFQKQLFTRITKVLLIVKSIFHFNNTENVTFVGVHYRGEDYNTMLNKTYREDFKGPPSFHYYKNAMQYFNETVNNAIFVFISSDKEWIKINVPHLKDFNVVVNPLGWNMSKQMVDDFVMLSSCNHSIINYGTYATASALFAGGTTIVYDMNLPKDGRGYSLAISIVSVLSNWFLCTEIKCCIKQ